MEMWVLIFILIGMGVGVSHISNQVALVTHAVNAQTANIKKHYEEPNIFVPSADEIAAAIVVQLAHESRIAQDIADKIALSHLDGSLETAISSALAYQTEQLKSANEWQLGFTHQLDDLKGQLEVIVILLNQIRDV